MLQGGARDGQMYSMVAPLAKGEIRVATTDATATPDDVPVEVYSLIGAVAMPGVPNHLHASYRWVGARSSSIHLVDLMVE